MINTFADYKIMFNRIASHICFISLWEPFVINSVHYLMVFTVSRFPYVMLYPILILVQREGVLPT